MNSITSGPCDKFYLADNFSKTLRAGRGKCVLDVIMTNRDKLVDSVNEIKAIQRAEGPVAVAWRKHRALGQAGWLTAPALIHWSSGWTFPTFCYCFLSQK